MATTKKKVETEYEVELDWQGEPGVQMTHNSGHDEITVCDLLRSKEGGGYFDISEIPELILWLEEIYIEKFGKSAIKRPDPMAKRAVNNGTD